ncbi:MAG: hypothetical protein PUP91_39295 [Rhizonema sp. PD37]|nr:hypothetical protein [Rhizonema sp. PD37]
MAKSKVLQTFVHEINNVLDIHVANEIISTTIDHLFWIVSKGWVAASTLHTGDLTGTLTLILSSFAVCLPRMPYPIPNHQKLVKRKKGTVVRIVCI